MRSCADMLHRSLRTVAPRVAFYKHNNPDKKLRGPDLFTRADESCCKEAGLDPSHFQAFKQRWAASSEEQSSGGTSAGARGDTGDALAVLLTQLAVSLQNDQHCILNSIASSSTYSCIQYLADTHDP